MTVMADVHSVKQRSYNMSRIRGRDTHPERIVRSLLRAQGYRYRCNVTDLPGKPDVILPALRAAIFVHGCFWHRHRDCRFTANPKSNSEFWEQKFSRTIERDREHTKALRKLGWKVIVIWECSLKEKPAAVRRKILALANPKKKGGRSVG
jgi:DNA mismatch endonuclease (patch repair protein)